MFFKSNNSRRSVSTEGMIPVMSLIISNAAMLAKMALVAAIDAVTIDSTAFTAAEIVAQIVALYRNKV